MCVMTSTDNIIDAGSYVYIGYLSSKSAPLYQGITSSDSNSVCYTNTYNQRTSYLKYTLIFMGLAKW